MFFDICKHALLIRRLENVDDLLNKQEQDAKNAFKEAAEKIVNLAPEDDNPKQASCMSIGLMSQSSRIV